MSLSEEKLAQVDLLIAGFDKSMGKGAVRILGGDEVVSIPRLSSGAASIDKAIGGGYPWGRIVEVYGPESSGKTTLLLHAIAQAQSEGRVCAFVDAEHALDVVYAQNLGVKVDELIISQPDCAEDALNIVDTLASSGVVDVIVVDSVAAMVPRKELEGEVGDSVVGLQARLMNQALRKVTGTVNKNNVLLFFINQIRMKIGVMFGSPETTTGGNGLKYYSSVRLDVRKIGTLADKGGEKSANQVRVKVVKNKTAPPYREAEIQVEFGLGINQHVDLVRVAVQEGILKKKGAWFSYKDENIAQGEPKAALYLKENPEVADEIKAMLKQPVVGDAEHPADSI